MMGPILKQLCRRGEWIRLTGAEEEGVSNIGLSTQTPSEYAGVFEAGFEVDFRELEALVCRAFGEQVAASGAEVVGIERRIAPCEDLRSFIGWELKSEGLCRADRCVPVPDRSTIEHAAGVDLVAVTDALGLPTAVDVRAGLVAVGIPAAERQRVLVDRLATEFTLPDLNGAPHSLSDWSRQTPWCSGVWCRSRASLIFAAR